MGGKQATLRNEPDWAALRREFPVTERWSYFDLANKAPLPLTIDRAMAAFVEDTRETGGIEAFSAEGVERARAEMAGLVGAPPETLAFVQNTAFALNMAAQGLRLGDGDSVVIAEEEHASNIFAWRHLEADGVEVRRVPLRDDGRVHVDDLLAAMDGSTRAVAVSWVGYIRGHRVNVPKLAEACRERGVLCVIDAIQAVGVLDVSLEACGADVVAAGAHKGLFGLNGSGLLYVRREVQDRIRPMVGGFERPTRGKESDGPLAYPPSAARYEAGNPNYLGIRVLEESAKFLRGIGMASIEARIRALTTRLIEGAEARGITVKTPRPWENRAGIVTIELPGDPETNAARMREAGVIGSVRGPWFRVSPHFFNTEDEVDALVSLL
ncbi:MAG: aminotransferase class V-fold PLP-dependent enzyme [Acetobacterales bacterium]